MNVTRESIFEALLTQLATAQIAGSAAFVTLSRKFEQWDAVPGVNQPAAYLVKGFEHSSQGTYGETKWRLKALLWVYCQHDPTSDSPGAQLNNVLDAVEQVLLPPPGFDRQTLGLLVANVYIDGEVIISEGSLPEDLTSVAVLPITIDTGI
jgi:hypothetical protein